MIREIKYEKLGKLADFKNGINYRRGSAGSNVRIINVKELVSMGIIDDNVSLPTIELEEKKYRPYLLKENDIVIARSASPGEVVLFKGVKETIYSGFSIKISFGNNIYPEFLYYYLQFYKKRVINASNGTIFQNLNQKILSEIDFPVINFDLQVNVSRILSALDDKIEVNNKINSNLEELAQTLYKRWFVDFEFPNEEGKPYKSSGGEMVESELGLIPKGWEVKSLREIMDFQGGFSFKGNRDNLDLKYKIITIKNVQDGYMDLSGVSSIEHKPNKLKESQVLQIGDVLVSLTGNVGRTCIVNQENCLLNQRVEKISPIDTELQGFNYFLFRSSQMNSVMQSLSKGSAQQNLSPVELSNQKIAITNELVEKFDVFNSLFQSILNNQIQNMSLTKTRDLLLPKLVSGEIEV